MNDEEANCTPTSTGAIEEEAAAARRRRDETGTMFVPKKRSRAERETESATQDGRSESAKE